MATYVDIHFETVKRNPNDTGRRLNGESRMEGLFDINSKYERVFDNQSHSQASLIKTHIPISQEGDGNASIECGNYYDDGACGNHFCQTDAYYNVDEYICDTCNQSFRRKRYLKKHIVQHFNNRKLYKCKYCPKEVTSRQSLRKHEARHLNENLYKCKFCKLSFQTESTLVSHVRTSHGKSAPYICEVCGLSFNAAQQLRRHITLHTGEKKYECNYCEKTFRRSERCKIHERTQHQRLTCDKCDLIFSNRKQLRKHRMVHLDRPFKCDQCDASFTQNTNLTKHKVIHSGVKPYKCHLCVSAYAHQSNLNKHLKVAHSLCR